MVDRHPPTAASARSGVSPVGHATMEFTGVGDSAGTTEVAPIESGKSCCDRRAR